MTLVTRAIFTSGAAHRAEAGQGHGGGFLGDRRRQRPFDQDFSPGGGRSRGRRFCGGGGSVVFAALVEAQSAAIGPSQPERPDGKHTAGAPHGRPRIAIGQRFGPLRQPQKGDVAVRRMGHGSHRGFLLRFFLRAAREPFIHLRRGRVARQRGMSVVKPEVRHQIGQLRQQHERHRHSHDDGAAAAFVHHDGRQPIAQAVGPGRDHEEESERQRQQQGHRRPAPSVSPIANPNIAGAITARLKLRCDAI